MNKELTKIQTNDKVFKNYEEIIKNLEEIKKIIEEDKKASIDRIKTMFVTIATILLSIGIVIYIPLIDKSFLNFIKEWCNAITYFSPILLSAACPITVYNLYNNLKKTQEGKEIEKQIKALERKREVAKAKQRPLSTNKNEVQYQMPIKTFSAPIIPVVTANKTLVKKIK